MKVILEKDIKGQGKRGQLIEVAEGYGRNYLLPRKLASEASNDNVNKMKQHDKAVLAQQAAEKAEAEAQAQHLTDCVVKLTAKGGAGGRLFGAVTTKEISDGLMAQYGVQIAKTKILQDEPIKAFGTYELRCKLGYEVVGTIYLVVAEEK